jgi:uncharacterized protein (TIGR00255 family)
MEHDVIQSMTGFASASGSHGAYVWTWEARSVNAKGRDLRLRVPDWIMGLEARVRALVTPAVARGGVTLSLRISREATAGAFALNQTQLGNALAALADVEAQAMDRGVSLAPSNACDILALPGLFAGAIEAAEDAGLSLALVISLEPVLASLLAMRASEGRALSDILSKQVDQIARLTSCAAQQAVAQKEKMAQTLKINIDKALGAGRDLDEARLAQEIAVLVVKSDVTEEIDRLGAHVIAAKDLLAQTGSVGRKLDFLMQEFNREANTLCSKSHSVELTVIGLDLKASIDQMREQVQNVE